MRLPHFHTVVALCAASLLTGCAGGAWFPAGSPSAAPAPMHGDPAQFPPGTHVQVRNGPGGADLDAVLEGAYASASGRTCSRYRAGSETGLACLSSGGNWVRALIEVRANGEPSSAAAQP